jgi:hypothetical protein
MLRTLPCPPGDVAGRFTETLAGRPERVVVVVCG